VPSKFNAFESTYITLCSAFATCSAGRPFRDPDEDDNLPEEQVFVVSWVDYCNKYGMGYALTDGSVGVHFNDTTTLVLSANKVYVFIYFTHVIDSSCLRNSHFDYITSRHAGSVHVRKSYTITVYPDELKSKVHLLKHFERYIMNKLYGDHKWCYKALEKQKGMEFVQKYLRMKHVILFKMSHDCLQVRNLSGHL
jgi:cell cycle serine/threonine-protein kinase CDC5/MSD2